jgi:hypothetical protein
MPEQQSIKETLDVIRKALEDDESSLEEIKDNVLILNKLVKEDGTIDVIEDNSLTKSEIKEILDNKLEELFDKHFEKWLNSKLPFYLEKYFNKK